MDNSTVPIPLVVPQDAASSSPAESPNPRWLLWSAIGLALLTLGVVIGLFGAKFFGQSQGQPRISSQLTPTPSPELPTQSLTPTPIPDPYREPAGSAATADWKTYSNPKYGFTFKYLGMMNLKTSEAAEDRDFLVMANINPPETIDFSVALYAEHSPKSTLETQTLRFHDPNPIANPPIQAGEFSSITTTQVAGIIANTFTSNLCTQTEQKCTVYTLSHAGYIFKISTTEPIKSSVTDQILSTFHFLK